MKPNLTLLSLALALAAPAYGQGTRTETTTETTTTNAAGTVKETVTTVTFNPEARTKVVQYFDTYKANPHGLPPGWVEQMRVKEIPVAWRTTRIAPGVVVTEKERPLLVEAPPALVAVLPAPAPEVRYYLAGSNVVAVNKTYQVVDSLQIPSVTFAAE